MRQFPVMRQVATIPFVEGASGIKVDLPRQYDLESIMIRISGTWTNADAATSIYTEAPTQLISRVELVADGKNTIFSAPFWKLVTGNFGRPESVKGPADLRVPPSAIAAAAYTVEATGCLDLASVDCLRPKDSNFRTFGLNLWELKFAFGRAVDIAADVAAATFVGTVEVWIEETVELPDESGKYSMPNFLRKTSFQQYDTTASNSNMEVRLPAGNLIRSVLIVTRAAGIPVSTVLNKATLQSGVDVRAVLSAAQIRRNMARDFGDLEQVGYYLLDFVKEGPSPGKLTNLWDVTQQAEPKLFLDVTGVASSNVQIVTEEYISLN